MVVHEGVKKTINMSFSIVIPCYNEKDNLSLLVKKFKNVVKGKNIKIILINNGSTDGSEIIIKDLCGKNSFLSSVDIKKNIGYGYGVVRGLKECATEYIGWTHADLQCRPEDVIESIEIVKDLGFPKNIYVKGTRKGRPIMDTFFTFGMSIFESLYFQKTLFDINAQPNLFHKDFFLKWVSPPDDFSLDLYSLYLAKKENLVIKRFEVDFPPRIHGESKWNTGLKSKLKFIKRTLSYSSKLKKELNKS